MYKVFRHKDYDFSKGCFPLGITWEEPQVFSETLPNANYVEFDNLPKFLECRREQRKIYIDDGVNFFIDFTGELERMIGKSTITLAQGVTYSESMPELNGRLSEGYWLSSYNIIDAITPIAALTTFHESKKQATKDYVNTNYPTELQIP